MQDWVEHQKQLVHAVTPVRPQRKIGPGTGTPRCHKCLRRDHTPGECPHGNILYVLGVEKKVNSEGV